jgi:class 3 adenylate cyclase
VYTLRGEYGKALKYQIEAFRIAKQLDARLDMAQSLIGMAATYEKMGDNRSALESYLKARDYAVDVGANYELKKIYEGLAATYSRMSDYKNAFRYQTLYASIKDTLYNIETDKKLSGLLFNFEMEKKQGEIDLLTKDKALQEVKFERQRFAKNAFAVGLVLILLIAGIIFRNYRIKVKTNKILDRQKEEIESLLLNILPREVAMELQQVGFATPRYYESASVLFTDFKGFTTIAEGLSPEDLVQQLNRIFSTFDDIIQKHNLEKIKTIGDAYMCAGGIPSPNTTHPFNIINAGLELQEYMRQMNERRKADGLFAWELRIGVHTGPLVAGVVGKKKYAYDIWGSTVNVASRMESNGEPGRVNISESTYNIIKDHYPCLYRGKIYAKNIGDIDMYFVDT